ncbi:MAG: cation:proton antiporter [Thermodesulfobacteriota bacterium]
MHGLIIDIGMAMTVATVIGIITHSLRQPIIVGYLIAGIILGPEIGPQLITSTENIAVISEIGLILLLFVIGMELDLKAIIQSGPQILATGVGQFPICAAVGVMVFYAGGFSSPPGGNMAVIYLALLCALSSTAIAVKSLNDKFEIETLTGRTSVGILVIQDLWVIFILAFQPNLNNLQPGIIGMAILKSVALVFVGIAVSKYVLKYIFKSVSKSPELVISISLGWCAFMAGLAGYLEVSKEMGALIAGISISLFPYRVHVTAKTLPLRDSFLILFFVSLGMKIITPQPMLILQTLGISFFIIVSRFIGVIPILLLSGGSFRTGFITSLNISQLSEFSLVVASIGVGLGHIPSDLLAVLIYTMALTSISSSYFIKFNHQIYRAFHKLLEIAFRRPGGLEKTGLDIEPEQTIFILGCHRGAMSFLQTVSEKYPHFLPHIIVLDYNLEVLKELKAMNVKGVFADISQLDTLEHLHINKARVIISSIPDVLLKGTSNLQLVTMCRSMAPEATIIATADQSSQIETLKRRGANEVLLPYSMAGIYLADYLSERLEGDLTHEKEGIYP